MLNADYDKVKQDGGPYDDLIQEAAAKHGVSYDLLHKQLFVESGFNPNAESPTGPRGIGQFTKATGNAYGLLTDADFMDPAKSIDAAARHMRDNIQMAGGDELKALLIYNQGAGPAGRKQIQAYDRGDLSGVSTEAIRYLRNMMDVAKHANHGITADALDAELKPAGGFEAPSGMESLAKVAAVAPDSSASFNMGGVDVQERSKSFAELLAEHPGAGEQDPGFFGGTGKAAKAELATSMLGMMVRSATHPGNLDFTQAYTMLQDTFNDPFAADGRMSDWTDEDYQKLANSDLDPEFYEVVLRGYRKNFDQNLAIALENQKMLQEAQQSGLGAQLVGGAVGMLGDPTTLVSPGKGAGGALANRVAGGALAGGLSGGLSEFYSTKMSGREAHYGMAIAGGALFGGAINGAFGARPGTSWDNPDVKAGYAEDWVNDAGMKADVPDAELEKILARHGESALPSGQIGLEGDMLPQVKDMPDSTVSDVLARHGERSSTQGAPDSSDLEKILAMHGDSAEPNFFAGPLRRLEAREKARRFDEDEDPAALPYEEGTPVHTDADVPYSEVPFEKGAVRTPNGAVHSAGSVLNPKTIKDFEDVVSPWDTKANAGVRFGDVTEIGYTLARSEDDAIRELAFDIFRSPTGYTNGSNGKYGATVTDILERLRADDHTAYNRMQEHMDSVFKEPFWIQQGGTRDGKRELISRRVVEAIESNTTQKLTAAEQKLAAELKQYMDLKFNYIMNPAQFGNPKATSLIQGSRHEGTYYPQVYSKAAVLDYSRALGADGLQEAIARSWLASYAKRPEVKARVDKEITEQLIAKMPQPKKPRAAKKAASKGQPKISPQDLQAAVEKYARDKAYGIAQGENFSRSSLIDDSLQGLTGLENNSFLEARNLFDSDVPIRLPDGSDFAVNDLREFDLMRVVPAYSRRTNGDIAIMGGTGKTTKELKDIAVAIHQKAERMGNTRDADALQEGLKMITGRARRDPERALGTFIRGLNDIGFVTKNAYMGVQNLAEAARLVVHGHLKMLTKDIPALKRITTAGTNLKPEDIRLVHDTVFGKEMDDMIRPTRQDIIDKLREQSGPISSKVAGSFKWATGELSARSPFTWLLRETGNLLLDAGRQGMLVDLAHQTLNGKASKLFSPERLRSASISPEQFKGIQDLIKSHFKMGADGKWSIENPQGLQTDPRAMDLWRLGDRLADEIILRPHKMSNQVSKAYGPLAAAALQFKMFVIRSINGRMVRSYWESYRNKQAADEVLAAVVSVGLATSFYAASAHLKAYGLPERKREEYLKKALDPNMLAYAGITRSSHIGAPGGLLNMLGGPLGFDPAAAVRTSILPRETPPKGQNGKPIRYNPLESDLVTGFGTRMLEQVPSAGVAANVTHAIYSGSRLLANERGDDAQGHRTGLWNALRNLVPNDPLSQNFMLRLAETHGVDRAR